MARIVSSVLVATLLVVGTTGAVPHADDCHADVCAWDGPHDPAAHRAGPGAPHDAHQHCAVCHWARTFRPSSAPVGVVQAPAGRALRVRHTDVAPRRLHRASQPPLRSPPPASPLIVL